jgi:alkanesulfonate monooxygenase SsuD/methylene tetrahydromethanopterin reductase-like flavin-dependent oxidoreductase (luciferase family)
VHVSVFMGPISMSAGQDLAQIEECIALAERSAEAGFAMVTFGEQHFNNYEPYANPFLMGARLAPRLGDTWFGTTIVPLVFHHPFRLAEDSNVIDLLTRGRFLMGVSSGRVGFVPDFQNWGLDPDERFDIFASKLDHLLRAKRQQYGDPPVVMDTPWDRGTLFGRIMPVSWRRGGAQIAIGTNTDATIDTVADRGWPLFLGPCLPDAAAVKLARHRNRMTEAGIPAEQAADAAVKSMVTRHVFVGPTEELAWETAEQLTGMNPMLDRRADPRPYLQLAHAEPGPDGTLTRNEQHVQAWMLAGSPDQVVEQLRGYAADGVQHVNLRFDAGLGTPELVNPSFDLFVREVLPHIDNRLFPALRDDEIDPVHLGGAA